MVFMFFIVVGGDDVCLRLANVVVELLHTICGDLQSGGTIRGLGENLYVGHRA
jgi:hypothetical protein